MKVRPLIFSGPMVRAILDGRKTQTRRVLKPQPPERSQDGLFRASTVELHADGHWYAYTTDLSRISDKPVALPIAPGDAVWVKEKWGVSAERDEAFNAAMKRETIPGKLIQPAEKWVSVLLYEANTGYEAKYGRLYGHGVRWRSRRYMPRWASRITLPITDVRIERVQDISEEDAIAEGLFTSDGGGQFYYHGTEGSLRTVRAAVAFADLWIHIHGPGAWAQNPWVAVYQWEKAHMQNINDYLREAA